MAAYSKIKMKNWLKSRDFPPFEIFFFKNQLILGKQYRFPKLLFFWIFAHCGLLKLKCFMYILYVSENYMFTKMNWKNKSWFQSFTDQFIFKYFEPKSE